jgi:hypothetical protein
MMSMMMMMMMMMMAEDGPDHYTNMETHVITLA